MLREDNIVSPAGAPLSTDRLDYDLPPELIATRPAEPRDSARMLVVHQASDRLEHARVRDLPEFLETGDALVFNTTAVAPARLLGRRVPGGGRVEGLFVEETAPGRWLMMLRCNGRLHPRDRIELLHEGGGAAGAVLQLVEPHPEGWIVRPTEPTAAGAVLDRVGRTPLPPYIRRARGEADVPDARDRVWYQTVYADPAQRQSVAAPTAGLHFTPELLERLEGRGVKRIDITLHVGPGTFKPITAPTIQEHAMHSERYAVTQGAVAALHGMRGVRGVRGVGTVGAVGGRIFAVGTTAVRTLESLPQPLPDPRKLDGPVEGRTDLMIAPPYELRLVDAMLTNFHLPRSTLLALVAAVIGLERLHEVYREAARLRYRFYSYGDAMLVLP